MKFPLDVAAWLQRNLVTMSIDDISAMGLSEANLNQTASGTADQWQFTVDMIYRCLVCGLISAGPTEKWLRSIHQPDVAGFARTLADINPYDFSGDPGHWFETFFVDTEFCRLRVAHYGLLNADVAEKIARNNLSVLKKTPAYYPSTYVKDEHELRQAVDHFLECAAISRAAGWYPGKNTNILVPSFAEEIEAIFEKCELPWSEKPLIPVRRAN
jgi:hypothetical protein